MHKPESVQKDETHKILGDFEIQIDQFISAIRPDLVITKKKKKEKTCDIGEFTVPADH